MEMFNLIKSDFSEELFSFLQNNLFEKYGIKIDNSKVNFIKNRLVKRLKKLHINNYNEYFEFIKNDETELINALVTLTTGESSFFRDFEQWNIIKELFKKYINSFIQKNGTKIQSSNYLENNYGYIHIWSAACSKGYEPYTIAIILMELFESELKTIPIKILASDINIELLKQAKEGFYTKEEMKNLDNYLIEKYFYKGRLKNKNGYFINPEIKDLITFAKINLVENFKFKKKFDFVFLKNVLIYFPFEIKLGVVNNISKIIKDNGYLILGTSENIFKNNFNIYPVKNHIYQKRIQKTSYNNIDKISKRKLNSTSTYSYELFNKKDDYKYNNYKEVNFLNKKSLETKITGTKHNINLPDKQNKLNLILKNYTKQFLNLGEYYVSTEPICISTVLGSCVSVCLFDEYSKIGAMNHFMLPYTGNLADPYKKYEFEKYGFWAMEFMLNEMLKSGANKKNIIAKLFGGANISKTQSSKLIGKANIEFATTYLNNENIPIVAQDIGENYARRIYFLTDTGKVYLVRIKRDIDEKDILKYEEDSSLQFMKKVDRISSSFEKFE